ncbi:hypothetical protein [Aquimarina macrocephali]|uniref:hypothetical protein n=1 Tax=Aquimarina macrocephali TaxID=666563 RepID=UPI000463A342|nr:hypothetical protein [Aquimarina macrocephali]
MIEQIKDLLTGEFFTPTRSDQRFATKENQIRYNNLKARQKRRAKAEIDRALDANRNILRKILNNKEEVIKTHDFLLGAGFNFGITTHKMNKEGKLWSCVYEYALLHLGDGRLKITKI